MFRFIETERKSTVKAKTAPADLEHEALQQRGIRYIIGLDEAGRGALAGPICVGYAVLPIQEINPRELLEQIPVKFEAVRDSKKFSSHSARKKTWEAAKEHVVAGGAIMVSAQEVDNMGINPATHYASVLAVKDAIAKLSKQRESHPMWKPLTHEYVEVFVDQGIASDQLRGSGYSVREFVRGDSKSISIAMASMYAKITRDEHMYELDSKWQGYGLADHKGYYGNGQTHIDALREKGVPYFYRRTYKTIRHLLQEGVPIVGFPDHTSESTS